MEILQEKNKLNEGFKSNNNFFFLCEGREPTNCLNRTVSYRILSNRKNKFCLFQLFFF